MLGFPLPPDYGIGLERDGDKFRAEIVEITGPNRQKVIGRGVDPDPYAALGKALVAAANLKYGGETIARSVKNMEREP